MKKLIFLLLTAALAAGCSSPKVQRPQRPQRPERPNYLQAYPNGTGVQRNRPERMYREYPGIAPW